MYIFKVRIQIDCDAINKHQKVIHQMRKQYCDIMEVTTSKKIYIQYTVIMPKKTLNGFTDWKKILSGFEYWKTYLSGFEDWKKKN